MKKLLVIPLLFFSLTAMAACSPDDTPEPETEQPTTPEEPEIPGEPNNPDEPGHPDTPFGDGKTLVAYFSAQGHTQAVAERIVELTGADIYRIEAAEPYAENPYDDSDISKTRLMTTCARAWPICPKRKLSRSTTRYSSARPSGGTSPQWRSVRSSKHTT